MPFGPISAGKTLGENPIQVVTGPPRTTTCYRSSPSTTAGWRAGCSTPLSRPFAATGSGNGSVHITRASITGRRAVRVMPASRSFDDMAGVDLVLPFRRIRMQVGVYPPPSWLTRSAACPSGRPLPPLQTRQVPQTRTSLRSSYSAGSELCPKTPSAIFGRQPGHCQVHRRPESSEWR